MDSPKLHFMDNVDPASFDALFHAINLRQTGFLVISNSGGTAETMMQFLVCLEALLKAVGPERAGVKMTALAKPAANPLRRIAARHGIPVPAHHTVLDATPQERHARQQYDNPCESQ